MKGLTELFFLYFPFVFGVSDEREDGMVGYSGKKHFRDYVQIWRQRSNQSAFEKKKSKYKAHCTLVNLCLPETRRVILVVDN